MENNTKQAVLSIIGIAVLVIAVVGVSFAFFTYSKQGTKNNVISTGSISFDFNEGSNGLTLENQFPQTVAEGKKNETFSFTVSGTIPTTMSAVNYTVYAVPGTAVSGKTRMKNSEIDFYVTTTGGSVVSTYASGGVVGNDIDGSTGLKIASGTINATGSLITHSYSMTMWVNDTVTISDTDTTKTYRASSSGTGTRTIYSNLYYSFKVKVVAEG